MNEASSEWEGLHQLYAALDPIEFARSLGIDPDPWQADLLFSNSKRIILNCSRQSGKSTIVAILSLRKALYTPNSLVLVLSRSFRQSALLFRKIADFYRKSGRQVPADAENKLNLKLSNGSEVVSLPGSEQTVRGFSGPSLIVIDEAALVDDNLYAGAIRPMLAVSQGRIILLSTPHGKRGFFFDVWEKGEDWEKIKITADQCSRITEETLKQERRELGERCFLQEYQCEFLESEDSLFRYDLIQKAIRDDIEELDLDLSGKRAPKKTGSYIDELGLD